jgi:uncharacterized membrane protein YkvA (DUF1232 family)
MAKKAKNKIRHEINLMETGRPPAKEPEIVEGEIISEPDPGRLSRMLTRIKKGRRNIEKRIEARAVKLGLNPEPLIKGIWEVLLLLPRLIRLMYKLTLDKRIPLRFRAMCVFCLLYVLSPMDIVPEIILGPVAFLDDLALLLMALNIMLNDVDPEILKEHWTGDEDVLRIIRESVSLVEWFIPGALKKTIKKFFKTKKVES